MGAAFFIFLGGGTGSVFRYALDKLFGTIGEGFPLGTFTANVLACLILGFLWSLGGRKLIADEYMRKLLVTGFCGGFSTFSTFSYESFQLMSGGKMLLSFIYIILSVVICLVAILIGDMIGKQLGTVE